MLRDAEGGGIQKETGQREEERGHRGSVRGWGETEAGGGRPLKDELGSCPLV